MARHTHTSTKVASPYTRKEWKPPEMPQRTKEHTHLVGATFGWWEILPPTKENYKQLAKYMEKKINLINNYSRQVMYKNTLFYLTDYPIVIKIHLKMQN